MRIHSCLQAVSRHKCLSTLYIISIQSSVVNVIADFYGACEKSWYAQKCLQRNIFFLDIARHCLMPDQKLGFILLGSTVSLNLSRWLRCSRGCPIGNTAKTFKLVQWLWLCLKNILYDKCIWTLYFIKCHEPGCLREQGKWCWIYSWRKRLVEKLRDNSIVKR